MYLQIKKINNEIILEAEKFLSSDFARELKSKSTFKESLVARYLISQKKWKFSSISHKDGLVFIWVSNKNIWIDIEIFKERDISLLEVFSYEEYNKLWWKNWQNFYILWTAKESIIKYLKWNLEEINNYKLIKVKKINKIFSEICFNYKLFFETEKWLVNVFSWSQDVFYYWFCFY